MRTATRIGVDIGGVIIDGRGLAADTFFTDDFLTTPEVPGAFSALAALTGSGHQVYLVSKCGPRVQEKTMQWLASRDFTARTGVPLDSARFCRKRAQKAPIAQQLGLEVFVDDRLQVLGFLEGVVATRFLFCPDPEERARFSALTSTVCEVSSWTQLLQSL